VHAGLFNGPLKEIIKERREKEGMTEKGTEKTRGILRKKETKERNYAFLTFSTSSVKIPLRLSGPFREGAAVTGLAAAELSYTQVIKYHQILRIFYTPVRK
jgi:hypothetical protein